ncbi:hTAFII28-like protein conserved region-domain-containing protein [Pyrenochaeta sp. MPI-SDFR-AT-0127]|nr:hTAFII28-like protein conserved region-domain-containing protein [Pyrenochaeta sp. MPI-SDFR-AT-0127]
MASPPPLPHLNVPRKRSSISSISSANPNKRRKPSNLRNAFSPDAESVGSPRFSRSPSLDSVATTSVVNGVGGKKRRRKGDTGDGGSVAGSSVRGGKGADGRSAVGGDGEGQDYEEEEDDDDMGEEMGMAMEEGGMTAEDRRKLEKDHERMLMEYMTPAQQERYATYRRIRLKRETVRKLVNQTLSQSVPQPVIIAVTSYAKSFLGELIDRALTVRDEWQAVKTHHPNEKLPPPILMQSLQRPSAHIKDDRNKPTNTDIQSAGWYFNQVDRSESLWKEINKDASLQERLKQTDKGPLTPAHLREALRRYKRDRDGGGAGFAGMSLEGVERTMGRTGGRRLFR